MLSVIAGVTNNAGLATHYDRVMCNPQQFTSKTSMFKSMRGLVVMLIVLLFMSQIKRVHLKQHDWLVVALIVACFAWYILHLPLIRLQDYVSADKSYIHNSEALTAEVLTGQPQSFERMKSAYTRSFGAALTQLLAIAIPISIMGFYFATQANFSLITVSITCYVFLLLAIIVAAKYFKMLQEHMIHIQDIWVVLFICALVIGAMVTVRAALLNITEWYNLEKNNLDIQLEAIYFANIHNTLEAILAAYHINTDGKRYAIIIIHVQQILVACIISTCFSVCIVATMHNSIPTVSELISRICSLSRFDFATGKKITNVRCIIIGLLQVVAICLAGFIAVNPHEYGTRITYAALIITTVMVYLLGTKLNHVRRAVELCLQNTPITDQEPSTAVN
jgi:hypothetical protein